MSDLQANLIEVTNKLGLNLTSNDSRINHTKTGEFTISSKGEINIEPTTKLGVTTNEVGITANNITITAKNFTIDSPDEVINMSSNSSIYLTPGYLSITTKDGSSYSGEDGNGIDIRSGDGTTGIPGGRIKITVGQSPDVDGEDIYIEGGYAAGNTGGGIHLDAGNGNVHGSVYVNVGTEYHPTTSLYDERECGRLQMQNGPFSLFVYTNETVRDIKIKHPVKGDMCLIETSTAGANLIHYYNGTAWKALLPFD